MVSLSVVAPAATAPLGGRNKGRRPRRGCASPLPFPPPAPAHCKDRATLVTHRAADPPPHHSSPPRLFTTLAFPPDLTRPPSILPPPPPPGARHAQGDGRRGRSLPRGGRLGDIPIKLSHRSGSSGKGASAAHPPPRCRRLAALSLRPPPTMAAAPSGSCDSGDDGGDRGDGNDVGGGGGGGGGAAVVAAWKFDEPAGPKPGGRRCWCRREGCAGGLRGRHPPRGRATVALWADGGWRTPSVGGWRRPLTPRPMPRPDNSTPSVQVVLSIVR